MSRSIDTHKVTLTKEEQTLQNLNNGKLIFTHYQSQKCALLLQQDRLIAAEFFTANPSKIDSIYIAKVKNVAKNIHAYFVEIANSEICFLPFKEASHPILLNRKYDGRILEGDELLVQVTRDAQKTKQAGVSTHIRLSNEAFVLGSGDPGIAFSSKLSEQQKCDIQKNIENIGIQSSLFSLNYHLTIRTKTAAYEKEALKNSFYNLLETLETLLKTASYRTCFSCIKKAPSPLEAVFEHLVYSHEYNEIITDDKNMYTELLAFIKESLPDKTLRYYEDTGFSLSKLYSLESKMDTALNTRIWLKSGAYLIIQPTEALTVIDVNSGKYEAKKDNEEYIYKINLEAAEEIALQMRLRNLSGIILVDFINMKSATLKKSLIDNMKTFVKKDIQKTSVIDITPLGLMEITRKKGNKTLAEQLPLKQ